jgi:hypothetical protein
MTLSSIYIGTQCQVQYRLQITTYSPTIHITQPNYVVCIIPGHTEMLLPLSLRHAPSRIITHNSGGLAHKIDGCLESIQDALWAEKLHDHWKLRSGLRELALVPAVVSPLTGEPDNACRMMLFTSPLERSPRSWWIILTMACTTSSLIASDSPFTRRIRSCLFSSSRAVSSTSTVCFSAALLIGARCLRRTI